MYSSCSVSTNTASSHSPLIKGFEKKTAVPLWHGESRGVSACPADMLHGGSSQSCSVSFSSFFFIFQWRLKWTLGPHLFSVYLWHGSWCCDVISSHKQAVFALQEAGWLNAAGGSRPMKVQRERGPVEQVCNLCVIWHCTSTPILCSRRWAGLRMRKKWHYM